MTKVLVGLDGSQLALDAARQALAILGDRGLEVTLVRVVQPAAATTTLAAGTPGTTFGLDPVQAEEIDDALEAEAAEDLAAAERTLGIAAASRVVHGPPGPTLCEVAADTAADVIVVGSHGTGFLKRVLLGSVSHDVLHHAPCPVLVVRATPETD